MTMMNRTLIAAALSLAEYFVGGERVCVILGDNLIEGSTSI